MNTTEEAITADNAISRYADLVYRLALSQVKNASDADDIFQEVFVRLVSHIEELKSWEHVKAWLIRVTVNCVKKYYSLFWNKNVTLMKEQSELAENVDGYAKNSYSMEEHPVTEAVKCLQPKYRLVIHLFYYEQLSVSEIGQLTGQKASTVKSQLFRAREMLKESLEGDPDL